MKKLTVLAVDDVLANRISLQYLIEEYCDDIDVILAQSGEEALKITYTLDINLIILDIQMPGMDGFETAKYLKSNPKTTNIPVIFLTAAFKKEEFQQKGFEIGAIDYLTKPIEDQQFINKIKLYKEVILKTKELEAVNHNLYQSLQEEIRLKETIQRQHREISEQSKMVALGEMLSNIAHQWRQPLSIISTCSSGMSVKKEMDILTDEELVITLEKITEITNQLSNTIDGFRSNIFEDIKTKCNLSEFIRNTVNSKSYLFQQNNITIVQDLDETIEIITLPNSLQQSLLNILINSLEALDSITADKYIFIDLSVQDDFINIIIKDNGGGIEQQNIQKVLEPYYTTKHKKQGIGLGLTNVYNNIVTNLHGKIKVDNKKFIYKESEYKGTQVIITLNYTVSKPYDAKKLSF